MYPHKPVWIHKNKHKFGFSYKKGERFSCNCHGKCVEITPTSLFIHLFFRWKSLWDLAKSKRDALNLAHSTSTFYIECNETMVRDELDFKYFSKLNHTHFFQKY